MEFVTGFPEILDGRVKTLHPMVHAGLLADTRKPEHLKALDKLDIAPFELVVVNLYPFSETVASGADVDECVEQIDIGGPAMVRAAAKNHPSVAVVTDPLGYDGVLAAVRTGGFTLAERKKLAALAFRHTAEYDVAVAAWMGSVLAAEHPPLPLPAWFSGTWRRSAVLRYGENPHQGAALYVDDSAWPGLAQAEQLHGKEMSYNNFTDADAAWRAAFDHEEMCVAIIKHANPCGIAISSISVADAHRKAHECDPVSAFGGVIAANTAVSVEMAETVADIFTEVIIAPAYDDGAVDVLSRKKNIRVLVASEPMPGGVEFKQVSGGLLLQQRDALTAEGDNSANWQLVAGRARCSGCPGRLDICLARLPRGEVERDRDRQAWCDSRRRDGSGEPRRCSAAGGRPRGREGTRRRRSVRRVLPVPRRPRDAGSCWCSGDRAPRRLDARRHRDRSGGQGRCNPIHHRRTTFRPLIVHRETHVPQEKCERKPAKRRFRGDASRYAWTVTGSPMRTVL